MGVVGRVVYCWEFRGCGLVVLTCGDDAQAFRVRGAPLGICQASVSLFLVNHASSAQWQRPCLSLNGLPS